MNWNSVFLVFLSFAVSSSEAQCWQDTHKYIGDLCYILSNQQLSFQDARSTCHQYSTQLGVIHTTTQANFLASLMRTQTGTPESLFWIGLSRQSVSSRFQWDDGTAMYWSNFDMNFPKDNLFVAESTVNGKWRTLNGQEILYFVCSYDPRGSPVTAPTTTGISESTISDATTLTVNYDTSTPSDSTTSPSTPPYTTETTSSSSTTGSPTTPDSPFTSSTAYSSSTIESSTPSTSTDTSSSTTEYSNPTTSTGSSSTSWDY